MSPRIPEKKPMTTVQHITIDMIPRINPRTAVQLISSSPSIMTCGWNRRKFGHLFQTFMVNDSSAFAAVIISVFSFCPATNTIHAFSYLFFINNFE